MLLRKRIATETIHAYTHSPLDLTKVRLQASGDKRMIESIKKTVRTAGVRGLFDGISGTWMRQMSYSLCRFWAYDESKKIVQAGMYAYIHISSRSVILTSSTRFRFSRRSGPNSPPWKLALAGSMGTCLH